MNQHLDRHEAKGALRREIRRQRQGLTSPFRTQAAAGFGSGLEQLCRAHPDGPILAYLPTDLEPPLRPALDKLRLTRHIWLPVVQPQREMLWVRWESDTQFHPTGPRGLMQPVGPQHPAPVHPALVLVPALAIDDDGVRLGMGGGYYDTFLADLHRNLADLHGASTDLHGGPGESSNTDVGPSPAVEVACVFHHEILPAGTVPADPWDARIPLVLTERGVRDLKA